MEYQLPSEVPANRPAANNPQLGGQRCNYEPAAWTLFAGIIITTVGVALAAAAIIPGTVPMLVVFGFGALAAIGILIAAVSAIFLGAFAIDNKHCNQLGDEEQGELQQLPDKPPVSEEQQKIEEDLENVLQNVQAELQEIMQKQSINENLNQKLEKIQKALSQLEQQLSIMVHEELIKSERLRKIEETLEFVIYEIINKLSLNINNIIEKTIESSESSDDRIKLLDKKIKFDETFIGIKSLQRVILLIPQQKKTSLENCDRRAILVDAHLHNIRSLSSSSDQVADQWNL